MIEVVLTCVHSSLIISVMGNSWACFAPKEVRFTREPSKRMPNFLRKSRTGSSSSSSPSRNKLQGKKLDDEDAQLRQQAIAAALLFRQHQQNLNPLPLNRSTSVVYPNPSPGILKKLPKSSSSRQRSRSDSLVQPHQLVTTKVCVNFPCIDFSFSMVFLCCMRLIISHTFCVVSHP